MSPKNFLTIEEVAKRYEVNVTTVYRLAQRGRLPGFKVGNQWRFNEELLKFWETQQVNPILLEEWDSHKKEGDK